MGVGTICRILAFFLLPGLAAAQEPIADSTQALDLKSALAIAETQNLELRAARQQRAMALAGLTTARQLPNPTVSFYGARDTPHEGVLWDQPIELGGKRGKRIAVAREEQRAAEIDIGVLSRLVRRRTREAFFNVLASRAQAGQAKAALDIASRIREIVQQRFEAGDVAQLDVIQADVELTRSSADYESAVQLQKSADAQLAALLHRAALVPVPLAGKLEEIAAAASLEQLTATALQSNAAILLSTQDLRTEQQRLALAKSQRIPNLDLQAGVDLNSPGEFDLGPRGQIGVTLPLFYHGQGEVALSNARIELLRLTLQSQQVTVSADVASAYFDYTAKFHLAKQYQERIIPQTVRLEQMAEDSYQSGKSNLLILIDAQRKLNDVQKASIDSWSAAQSSFALLEEVVGTSLD